LGTFFKNSLLSVPNGEILDPYLKLFVLLSLNFLSKLSIVPNGAPPLTLPVSNPL